MSIKTRYWCQWWRLYSRLRWRRRRSPWPSGRPPCWPSPHSLAPPPHACWTFQFSEYFWWQSILLRSLFTFQQVYVLPALHLLFHSSSRLRAKHASTHGPAFADKCKQNMRRLSRRHAATSPTSITIQYSQEGKLMEKDIWSATFKCCHCIGPNSIRCHVSKRSGCRC